MLMRMNQKPGSQFSVWKLHQFNIFEAFVVIQIGFLQANTKFTVAVSRLGSVSRVSNISVVFNLEAPFSRMER